MTQNNGILIVPLNDLRIRSAAEIERQCFDSPWNETMIRESMNAGRAVFLAALDGEKTVGYISIQPDGFIINVGVLPDFRRRGIGRMLVLAAARCGMEQGAECITLEVRVSNHGAVKLYEGLGFRRLGIRKNCYRNPAEDGYVYRLDM